MWFSLGLLLRLGLCCGAYGVFFEGIGVLAKRKLINMDLVDDLFSAPISQTWERMGPIVKGMREQMERPSLGEWFEYVYNKMNKREQNLQPTS
jgi:hypothetical protein